MYPVASPTQLAAAGRTFLHCLVNCPESRPAIVAAGIAQRWQILEQQDELDGFSEFLQREGLATFTAVQQSKQCPCAAGGKFH